MQEGGKGPARGRVHVFTRVRPASGAGDSLSQCVDPDEATGTVRVRNDSDAVERVLAGQAADAAVTKADLREFSFDGAFPTQTVQRDVFNKVGLPVLRESLMGFNGTILAYGQTGSGKTFSLQNQGTRPEEVGLLPRLVAYLFVHIAQDHGHVYTIEAAAVQVYNEQVDDLLHPDYGSGGGQNLNVQGGGVVAGLTWLECRQPEVMLEAFTKARANLVYAETKMNKASSRSHAVFQIRIAKRQQVAAGTDTPKSGQKMECIHAQLNIVDLAGSERVKKSGAEGVHFKEATNINKSLLAFGNVVSALATKRGHVPFRDSKLTRILEGSIGGNCKTSLLVCVSPALEHVAETLNTLEFASRAMRVEVDAKVNVKMVEVSAKAMLADMQTNPEEFGFSLNSEIQAARRETSEALQRAAGEALRREQEVAEAEKTMQNLTEEVATLRRSRDRADKEATDLKQAAENASRFADEQRKAMDDAKAKLQESDKAQKELAVKLEHIEQEKRAVEQRSEDEVQRLKQEKEAERTKVQQALEAERSKLHQEVDVLKKALEAEKSQRLVETDALSKELQEELQTVQKAFEEERTGRAEAEDFARKVSAAKEEAHERLSKAEALKAQLEESLVTLREEASAREASWLEDLAALEKQLAETRRCEESLQEQVSELTEQKTKQSAALEKASKALEVAQQEAAVALETLRTEASERELHLQEEHLKQRSVAEAAHAEKIKKLQEELKVGIAKLQEELTETKQAAQKTLSETEAHQATALAEVEEKWRAEAKRWQEERAEIEADHAARVDTQHQEFEARLQAGRAELEGKLQEAEQRFAEERTKLSQEIGERRQEQEQSEATWRDDREDMLRQCADRETELRVAYEDLARRFSQRESRPEDTQRIRDQQQHITEHQRSLRLRETQLEYLHRELQNRDETDRIFGSASARRQGPTPRGSIPPLPGKKPGSSERFVDKRRRAVSASRSRSAQPLSMSSSGASLLSVPVLAS